MNDHKLPASALCPRWRSGAHFFAPAVTMDGRGTPVPVGVCICGLAASVTTPPELAPEITAAGLNPPKF